MILLFYLLLVIAVAAGISAAVATALMRGRDERALRGAEGHLEDRLRRLEATVESMSAELERVSEGHRFLTDVLTERRAGESGRLPPADGEE